jgi:hypothetical protein
MHWQPARQHPTARIFAANEILQVQEAQLSDGQGRDPGKVDGQTLQMQWLADQMQEIH